MAIVYLGVGSNIGDRRSNLTRCLQLLEEYVDILAVSDTYLTDPWGVLDQPEFYNLCLRGETTLSPDVLLHNIKMVEKVMGRTENVRWGPRVIDIDVLFYDDLIISGESLTIPHPRLEERAFVLVPLADIAPSLRHPCSDLTIRELLENVDTSGVRRLT